MSHTPDPLNKSSKEKKKKKKKPPPPLPPNIPPSERIQPKDLGRALCLAVSLRLQITDHYLSERHHYYLKRSRIRELLHGALEGDEVLHEKLSKIAEKGAGNAKEDPNLLADVKRVDEIEHEVDNILMKGSNIWVNVSELEEKLFHISEIEAIKRKIKHVEVEIKKIHSQQQQERTKTTDGVRI